MKSTLVKLPTPKSTIAFKQVNKDTIALVWGKSRLEMHRNGEIRLSAHTLMQFQSKKTQFNTDEMTIDPRT